MARLKDAYSGTEARDFVNGTSSNIQNGAFQHSYGYDAFSNVTSRSGRYWSEPDTGTDNYNNQGRNIAWSYDADGRVITTNEPPPNPYPYSPLTFGYDAAGRSSSSGYTISRPNGSIPFEVFTTISSKNNTYDGNGRLAKMSETTQWENQPSTTSTRYYLRSSLTGNVIAEYDQNGTKLISTVYAGGEVIAQQIPSDPGPNMVVWQHANPITGDGINTNSQGWLMDRTTVDPTGVNTGDTDPFGPPAGAGQLPDPSQSAIDHMVAQLIPGYALGPKCYVNGSLTGCGWVGSLLSSGAFENARPSHAPIYSARDSRYVGFAFFNRNQAAQGVSVFGLPVGWSPTGLNFAGNQWNISSSFGSSAFTAAAMNDLSARGMSGLAGYLGDLASDSWATIGQIGELSWAYNNQAQQQTQQTASVAGLYKRVGRQDAIDMMNRAYEIAKEKLKNEDCRKTVDGYYNALEVLEDLSKKGYIRPYETVYNRIGSGNNRQVVIAEAGWTRGWNRNGSIDLYNAFFTNIPRVMAPGKLSDDEARALIIIHELGHVTREYFHGSAYSLFGTWAKAAVNTKDINRKIYENCFKK